MPHQAAKKKKKDWKDTISESHSVALGRAAAALGTLSKKKLQQLKDPGLEIAQRKSKNWNVRELSL